MRKPVVLVILDGWGIAPAGPGNAISQAKTPNFNQFWTAYPKTQLTASGQSVGLPHGEPGNSETGHLNLGAGQIVFQDLPRINISIANGSFFLNPTFKAASDHVIKNQSALHLMGLLGEGGVHSSLEHLLALLHFAKQSGLKTVYLHLFTDGRDSPPTSAPIYLSQVENEIARLGIGKIASLCGRYYAMDRDFRWERIQKAYDLLTLGKGNKANNAIEGIKNSYSKNITDEFIEPIILDKNGVIQDNDAVIFFNFRIDRPRQLTKAFVLPNFETMKLEKVSFDPYAERYGLRIFEAPKGTTTFKREKVIKQLFFVTMTEYEKELPVTIAFAPINVMLPLGRVLAEKDARQICLAESEKIPHVTIFFAGGREKPFPGQEWVEIPSPKVSTYDQKPEMSANFLTEEALKRLSTGTYDFMLINFANPDMLGHTGVITAAIKGCEVVDGCLKKIVDHVLAQEGVCLITADHGNAEEMINISTGEIDTRHSSNPVPLIVCDRKYTTSGKFLTKGILADVAPTLLSLMEIEVPEIMIGKNLLA